MNKKGLITKLAITATFAILIIGILPTVQAGRPPFVRDLYYENNLVRPWMVNDYEMEFDSSENIHFRIGAARSIEEKENDWWPKLPWRYRLYINGEEIDLKRFASKGDKETTHPPVLFFWYHIFGPDYFTPGEEYLLKFEFWVKNPYQGDGLKHWRIFTDYWGIYGEVGTEWSFEYYLNIV